MNKLAIRIVTGILLTLFIVSPIWAEAYNVILQDENIRISLYYPPEVKINSCYNFRLEVQAFNSFTIEEIKLTIKMYRDGVTETLYDEAVVSSLPVTNGWTFSKNIIICIPTPRRPDPFLEARIYADYMFDDSDEKTLSTEWYASTIRVKTYDELVSELQEAKKRIKYMEERIDNLNDDIDKLEKDLDNVLNSYNTLLSDYNSLQSSYRRLQEDYASLQNRYMSLQDEHKGLNEDYRRLLIDYEKLRTLYEELSDNNRQLQSNYDSLRGDYTSLSREYYRLQGIYQDLSGRYDDLKSRYESGINTIGKLQSTIEDLEKTIKEKEEKISELNLMYTSTANENILTKNILYVQTAAVIGAGAGIYIMNLRRKKTTPPPPPSTPAPEITKPRGEKPESSGNGRIQKILSGRRITLPRDALEKLRIKDGEKVLVELHDGFIKVMPVKEEVEGANSN